MIIVRHVQHCSHNSTVQGHHRAVDTYIGICYECACRLHLRHFKVQHCVLRMSSFSGKCQLLNQVYVSNLCVYILCNMISLRYGTILDMKMTFCMHFLFKPRVTQLSMSLLSLNIRRSVYKGADKSLARPGRNQATATEDFEFHISYL